MKKWIAFILILLCFGAAFVWGYAWLLNTYIPSVLFPKTAVRETAVSTAVETGDDAAVEVKPRKSVVKLPSEAENKPKPPSNEEGLKIAPARGSTQAEIVTEILKRSDDLEEEIAADISGFSDQEIAEALLKSGKYYYLSWSVLTDNNEKTMTITPKYKIAEEIYYAYETGDETRLSRKAKATYDIALGIIKKTITPRMSDYEKALAIHDYIVLNARYDSVAAKKVDEKKEFADEDDSFTAFGLLFNKRGICQAYSEVFNIFMRLLGIECGEVTGDSEKQPHSWNRIRLGGEYYQIDVTWDDPTPDKPGETSHAYFCVTDDMLAKDHIWEKDNKDCISLDYNYFVRNNLIVKNQGDFERVFAQAAENGELYIEFKQEGFHIEKASFEFASRLTGQTRFTFSEAGEQGVVTVYLK